MTAYEFGDVLLLPFPFTDQTGVKKRPAVVVSSKAYNQSHLDVVVMAITTQESLPTLERCSSLIGTKPGC